MLNFPVAGGTSGHFLGAMLACVLLGPFEGFLVMTTVLIVQCFFFADGGLTALGANIFNMGIVGGLLSYYLMMLVKTPLSRWIGEKKALMSLSLIHISEHTRLGMNSYAVFCLKKKKKHSTHATDQPNFKIHKTTKTNHEHI